MRKLTKLLSALIVLVLATAFIGCGNPSSGGGNSNSSTDTTVAGGTYLHSASAKANGFAFDDSIKGKDKYENLSDHCPIFIEVSKI